MKSSAKSERDLDIILTNESIPAEEDSGGAEEEARRCRGLGLQPDLVAHRVAGALVALRRHPLRHTDGRDPPGGQFNCISTDCSMGFSTEHLVLQVVNSIEFQQTVQRNVQQSVSYYRVSCTLLKIQLKSLLKFN